MLSTQATGEPTPTLTAGNSSQRFWWALLITLIFIFLIWGFFYDEPINFLLWGIGIGFLCAFIILVFRGTRSPAKLEFAEVRRLITCDKCGVETEGPLEPGDHVFQEIGPCPRCEGLLYIKAIYSIDTKQPLKRQQPKEDSAESESQVKSKS